MCDLNIGACQIENVLQCVSERTVGRLRMVFNPRTAFNRTMLLMFFSWYELFFFMEQCRIDFCIEVWTDPNLKEKKNLAEEHRTSKTHHSVLELCTVCVTGANYFLLLAVRKASLLQGSIISSIQKTKDLKRVKNQKP